MMKRTKLLLAGLIACLSFQTALADDGTNVRAMTRNLYIGANTFRILTPVGSPEEFLILTGDIVDTMLQSQFQERAKLVADEIERTNPQVVGLQEVTSLTGMPLSADPRLFPDVDFLGILEGELAARGLDYDVPSGAISMNAEVTLPAFVPLAPGGRVLFNVNLVDHDVILVRGDIAYNNADNGNYLVNAVISVGGMDIEFTRGWGSVDIHFDGHSYRFLNTHLEVNTSEGAATVQAFQTVELLLGLGGPGTGILTQLAINHGPLPMVLAGDFNSAPDGDCIHPFCADFGTPYQLLSFAGFQDVWNLRKNKNKESENTCCFEETLDDPNTMGLLERLDHIWVSAGIPVNGATVRTVGDELKRRTADGLFPSDHLGVFARMSLEIAP
jgi:endonuclease/exonuclease/phosphatase family metal-dependent hydrolase